MTPKEYMKMVRQDITRSFASIKKVDGTYFFRICAVFVLNVFGIIGFAVMQENFPLPVFCALWGISALIIIEILWHIFSENIAKNMPDSVAKETQIRGVPVNKFRCRVKFIGNTYFRGLCSWIWLYVYEKEILLKYGKHCLIINSAEQIKICKMFFYYRCEFSKDERYVQCSINENQVWILQQWISESNR